MTGLVHLDTEGHWLRADLGERAISAQRVAAGRQIRRCLIAFNPVHENLPPKGAVIMMAISDGKSGDWTAADDAP